MWKFLIFCWIKLKFCSWLYKKRWHTLWKFQFEKTSNKTVIAKKPLTNLYEMNSSYLFLYLVLFRSSITNLWASLLLYMYFRFLSHCSRPRMKFPLICCVQGWGYKKWQLPYTALKGDIVPSKGYTWCLIVKLLIVIIP